MHQWKKTSCNLCQTGAYMKYWFISWTDPLVRFIGFEKDFYDGPIYSIGFWFFHIEYHPWGRPL